MKFIFNALYAVLTWWAGIALGGLTTWLGGALVVMAALQTYATIMTALQEHGERKGLTARETAPGATVRRRE